MLFKRRHKRHLFQHLRELMWPSAGWVRTLSYVGHRLKRLPGSPYSIAAGFACGAAVSFTPLIGAHLAVGMLLAWMIGANAIAAGIGTVVGNPWTFPFIWYWTYRLGTMMLGTNGDLSAESFSFARILDDPVNQLGPILVPMSVGSIPTFIVSWVVFYVPLRGIVAGYQKQRRHRLECRARERRAARGQVSDETHESEVG